MAPVVEQGATARQVYLPRGGWFDFWTGERLEGGREITRKVDLETMPLYVRAGSILPLGPMKQWTGEKVDEPLEISIYPRIVTAVRGRRRQLQLPQGRVDGHPDGLERLSPRAHCEAGRIDAYRGIRGATVRNKNDRPLKGDGLSHQCGLILDRLFHVGDFESLHGSLLRFEPESQAGKHVEEGR